MTEKEKLMYDILARISNAAAPIVFKGALITKLILAENRFDDVQRMTKDIDANWIDTPPSMEALADAIYRSLGDLKNQFTVEATRTYGKGKSAGLAIKDNFTGDKIISMDIDIKPTAGSRTYYLGESIIKGVLANEIIADKISTMSSDAIYKHRAKDMVDIYSLAHCIIINGSDIYDVCQKNGREIQSFDAFFHKKDFVEHAYDKLKGIVGKPVFSDVYNYLCKFVQPFSEKNFIDKTWNPTKSSWEQQVPITKTHKAPKTSIATLHKIARKVSQESPQESPKEKKHSHDIE